VPASSTGIDFERHGEGEPLLLVHGTGGSRQHWRPIVGRMVAERDVLLVDLPGHGQSALPPAGVEPTPPGYAPLLAGLLDELGLGSAHVAGNSVGGWTALELAKLGRARSVVALAPAGLWPKRSPWSSVTQLWVQNRLGRLTAPLVPRVMGSEVGRTLFLRGAVAKPRQVPPQDAIELATTFARTPGFDEHLAATRRTRFQGGQDIDVAVTIAWGEREHLIPGQARRREELPPHTRWVELPGCGHVPTWDDPDLVARTILEGTAEVGDPGLEPGTSSLSEKRSNRLS
jgi:pimeloyl-ACP methyl ester carboxylesterase